MRGRTNITPRKEPIINGQLITATVEANDSISVGDFVEYRIDYAETVTSDYNISVIDELETSTYKILLIAKNSQTYLELWKKSTQERVDNIIIDEYRGYGVSFDLVDDTHLIAKNYSCTYYYIGISNDSFTIIQSLTQYSDNYAEVCVLDSSHFISAFKEQSGSSTYYIRIDKFSFDSNGITYINNESIRISFASNYTVKNVKKVANDRIMIFCLSTSNSGQIYLFGYDNNYAFSNISSISAETSVDNVIRINEILFAFLNYTSQSSGDRFKLYLMKYDSVSDAIAIFLDLDLSTIFGTFSRNRGAAAISLLNENQLAICGCIDALSTSAKREGVILTYDENEDTYSISEKIEVANTLKYTDVKFTIADSTNAKIVSEIGFIKLKIQDNEFEHVPDKNYVKSYTGGKAIGFAKTAGVGGDSIRIYVPVV